MSTVALALTRRCVKNAVKVILSLLIPPFFFSRLHHHFRPTHIKL